MPVNIEQARLNFFRQQFEKRLSNETDISVSFKSVVSKERKIKEDLIAKVDTILENETDPTEIGEQFYKAVIEIVQSIFRNSIAKLNDLKKSDIPNYQHFCSLYGNVLVSKENETQLFSDTYEKIQKFHYGPIENTPGRADMVRLLIAALSTKPDSRTMIGGVEFFGRVTKFFLGNALLTYTDNNVGDSFNQANEIVSTIYAEMKNEWGWNPADIIDVQCALWIEFHDNIESYTSYSSD